jgi:hypothetical protein
METCRMCAPQQQPAGKKAESARTLDGRHLQTLAEGRVRKGGQKGTRTHTHTRAHTHTHTWNSGDDDTRQEDVHA